jgi:hypothetical protein
METQQWARLGGMERGMSERGCRCLCEQWAEQRSLKKMKEQMLKNSSVAQRKEVELASAALRGQSGRELSVV